MFVPKGKQEKLAPQFKICIFLEYGSEGQFGYWLWDLELTDVSEGYINSDYAKNLDSWKFNHALCSHTQAEEVKRSLSTIETEYIAPSDATKEVSSNNNQL